MSPNSVSLVFRDYVDMGTARIPVALLSHFGTSTIERWILTLKTLGIKRVQVYAPGEFVNLIRNHLEKLEIEKIEVRALELGLETRENEIIVVADYLVHPNALRAFIQGGYSEGKCQNLTILHKQRIDSTPVDLDLLVEPVQRPVCVYAGDVKTARKMLIRWSQKRIHLISRLNAPIENLIVRSIGDIPWITPNRVTILVTLLAPLTIYLFLGGNFLLGSIIAYIAGILDGVDGKLARARGRLTKLGNIEHSLDALWEQSVYASIGIGLGLNGYGVQAFVLGTVFLVIDSFVRHIYNQFMLVTGRDLKTYSEFDRKFATIDGRRNFYIIYILVSTILGNPLGGLVLSLAHSTLTAIVYLVRSLQHLRRLD